MCLFYWLKSKRSKKTHMIEAVENNPIEVNSTWVPETTNSGVLPSRSANRGIGSPSDATN